MRWRIEVSRNKPRVALFCSRYTHCIADLLHRWKNDELHCEILLVFSNHRDAEPLARFYGVEFTHVPVSNQDREAAEKQQLRILEQHQVEMIVLARYMQVLSPAFVQQTLRASLTSITRFCRHSAALDFTTPPISEESSLSAQPATTPQMF